MAKKKKKTTGNNKPTISRDGNKLTAKWKIKTKSAESQRARYRIKANDKWGSWIPNKNGKKLGKSATSYSFNVTDASFTSVEVQTRVCRKDTNKTNFINSSWSGSTYEVKEPPAPTVTVENASANRTVFTWNANTDNSAHAWSRRTQYRTKCSNSPDDEGGWGEWTTLHTTDQLEFTDATNGTTRIIQFKNVGPAGETLSATERHYIGPPPVASFKGAPPVVCSDRSAYYEMIYSTSIAGSHYTVDDIVPQYYIGIPLANMSCPGGASWTDGGQYDYEDGKSEYPLAITTSDMIDKDECLWARVKTVHDGIESYSGAYRVKTGELKDPTVTVNVGTPSKSGFSVVVTVDDAGTEVPGIHFEVYLEKKSKAGEENYIKIGTIPGSAQSATITSKIDLTGEEGYSIHVRSVTNDGYSMVSGYTSYKASMPVAPKITTARATTTAGKVYLEWTTNWSDATGAIIAWTDDPDNWMSNDEPEQYEVHEDAGKWFITGLETGKTWYFKIRSMLEEGENVTKSSWSEEESVDLSSAPATPLLWLSDDVITDNGMVTAYWSYVSRDGTSQIAGKVVVAEFINGAWTYGDNVGSTTDAQHIDIYAKSNHWANGTSVFLALQTQSGSGGVSEYSTPVRLTIAAKPTVSLTCGNLSNEETLTEWFVGDGTETTFLLGSSISGRPTATVDGSPATIASYSGSSVVLSTAPAEDAEIVVTYTTRDTPILSGMPLNVSVRTTNAFEFTLAIERAETYPMRRPDGTDTEGPAGETVYVRTFPAHGTDNIGISLNDLGGRHLDDGAYYNVIATVKDKYGQEASTNPLKFRVHWQNQAWYPTASFFSDEDNYIVRITPHAATGYHQGDTCDIYRLGADQPELIVSGATFGTEYVDPYPAFGEKSGYSIVTITENGDYITADNHIAEYNTTEEEDTDYVPMNPGTLVIDFDENRVELPYNISLDNSWAKDFERTVYLGGRVVGDHNRTVTRDLSASTVLVRGDDEDVADLMRDLSVHADVCHVRTPEGSSFVADVQVREARSYDSGTIDYSLEIKRVDPIGYDGMTYYDWRQG